MENKLEKKYGLFTAICMVVGIVVGSGVFFKAQVILQKTGGDMPLGVLAWLIGGAIMIVCILAFSAMAQKYEKVNGIVDYAEAIVGTRIRLLHRLVPFHHLLSHAHLGARLAERPLYAGVRHLRRSRLSRSSFRPRRAAASSVPSASRSCSSTWSAPTPSTRSRRSSPVRFQVATTVIKFIPARAHGGRRHHFRPRQRDADQQLHHPRRRLRRSRAARFFAAVCATAFAYEGWIIATSINAELKDSKRNLPKALLIGGLIIVATYILYYIGVAGGATNQELMRLRRDRRVHQRVRSTFSATSSTSSSPSPAWAR